jgi:zinc protease
VPTALFNEQLQTALYLHHPYRMPTIGWEHEMHGLETADALGFYHRWYAPNNAVLIIDGDVSTETVKTLATKYFGPIPARSVPPRERVSEPPKVAAARLTMKSPRVTEVNWEREYLAPSYHAGDKQYAYALQVLAEVLGGSASSPLYKELVMDKKLALSVNAFYDPDVYDLTSFGFSARLKSGTSVDEFESALEGIVKQAVADGITTEQVERAKARMRASAAYARDSISGPARIVGAALAIGRSLNDVEEWPERIGAVTLDQVYEAARLVIHDDTAVTGILSPGPTS